MSWSLPIHVSYKVTSGLLSDYQNYYFIELNLLIDTPLKVTLSLPTVDSFKWVSIFKIEFRWPLVS